MQFLWEAKVRFSLRTYWDLYRRTLPTQTRTMTFAAKDISTALEHVTRAIADGECLRDDRSQTPEDVQVVSLIRLQPIMEMKLAEEPA